MPETAVTTTFPRYEVAGVVKGGPDRGRGIGDTVIAMDAEAAIRVFKRKHEPAYGPMRIVGATEIKKA